MMNYSFSAHFRPVLRLVLVLMASVGRTQIIRLKFGATVSVDGVCLDNGNCKPETTRRWTNVGLMVGQRHRQWANIKTTMVQRLVFAGKLSRLQLMEHVERH